MPLIMPNGAMSSAAIDLTLYERDVLINAQTTKIILGVEDRFEKNETQLAFIQCVEKDYIRLLDVTVLSQAPKMPPRLCRVFGITKTGEGRLKELVGKLKIDSALKAS